MHSKLARYGLLFYFLQLTVLLSFLMTTPPRVHGSGPIAVLTQHNDNSRTGANLNETVLNTSNVNVAQFGKVFSLAVDGQIYAQPLFVPSVSIPGRGTHNVIYVVTQHNTVYAFDADAPSAMAPLWQKSLGTSVSLPRVDIGPDHYRDIQIEVGVTSTPVIDLSSNTLYTVAFTNESSAACNSGCIYAHRLHALDIATGAEKFGGPVVINGSVPGAPLQLQAPVRLAQMPNTNSATSPGRAEDVITFDSQQQLQRPGLLLSQGVVYIAFGSYGDATPYHGWVFGYAADTLDQVSIWNTTPNGSMGAVWQAGQGLSADTDGAIYLMTGNGTYSDTLRNFGNSLVRLDPLGVKSGVLSVVDWFTPYNQEFLNSLDLDIGTTGPLLIPGTNLVLGSGKQGILYLVNRNAMGHYNGPAGPDNVVQRFSPSSNAVYSSPVFWSNPDRSLVYIWPINDVLRAYSLQGELLNTTPQALGTTTAPMPGGILSVSADGSNTDSGILWASQGISNSTRATVPGILRAYDASNIGTELWDSTQNPYRDAVGNFAKFCPPTVANGRVYLATFSNQLDVYGFLTPPIYYFPMIGKQ